MKYLAMVLDLLFYVLSVMLSLGVVGTILIDYFPPISQDISITIFQNFRMKNNIMCPHPRESLEWVGVYIHVDDLGTNEYRPIIFCPNCNENFRYCWYYTTRLYSINYEAQLYQYFFHDLLSLK